MGQNKEQVKYVVQAFELILCPFPTSNPSEPRPAPSSAPWSGLKPLLGHGCLASRRAMETSGLRAPCTAVSSVLLTNPPHRPLRSGLCQLPPGNINICRSKARTQGISRWRGSDAHGNGCLSCFLIRGSSVSPEEPSCGHLCHCPLALSNPGRVFHSLSISLHPAGPCLPLPTASLSPAQNSRPPTSCAGLWGPLILSWPWQGPLLGQGLLERRAAGGGREARGRAASGLPVQLPLVNPFIPLKGRK